MRKRDYCLCENKGADQLRNNFEADQRLCFRYSDSTIPLLLNPKFQASSSFLSWYRSVCVRPGITIIICDPFAYSYFVFS